MTAKASDLFYDDDLIEMTSANNEARLARVAQYLDLLDKYIAVHERRNRKSHNDIKTKAPRVKYVRSNQVTGSYPAGTGFGGCVALLQPTDEALGSSDSNDSSSIVRTPSTSDGGIPPHPAAISLLYSFIFPLVPASA